MKIISVVRDFELYNRLVKQNRFNQNAEFIAFDNNQDNESISKRYNSFLDGYDYADADWFVFCHEDWELKEDLNARLEPLDKTCLYGAIGVPCAHRILWSPKIIGQVEQCAKDGTKHILQGNPSQGLLRVGTFDCQCVIVHSSLIKQHHLRFDEHLTFDLYVEDFCITAGENYKIPSKVLPIKCCHWSYGNVTERFYQQLQYLRQKHNHADNLYISIVDMSQITKGVVVRTDVLKKLIRGIARFVLQVKTTKSGKLCIKFCKIPVLSLKSHRTPEKKA